MAKLRLVVKNQRGQMAIFIALIFQVLFMFFAMAINMALVVHDKINLQNSVDLAAYYAGQRQAEWLNVIAHTNYQIRQSWKLLNWRYYVLGSLGLENPKHPAQASSGYPHAEVQWSAMNPSPVLCVTQKTTFPGMNFGNDNPCKNVDFRVGNLVIPAVIAGWVWQNVHLHGLASQLNAQIIRTCNGYAGYNWFFATSAFVAYMNDQASRKELIQAAAKMLAKPPSEMIDLNGDLIYEGALKTFQKNLTAANASSLQDGDFELINSLEGLAPQKWLNEMDVWFTLFYQDLHGTGQDCSSSVKRILELPSAGLSSLVAALGEADDKNLMALYQATAQTKYLPPGNPNRLSMGVEKNPWYMAYMEVRGRSRPRAIFFPFGEPVQFEARAFVKPFGGRIGPWYGSSWSRNSSGSEGEPMQLAPERLMANGDINLADERNLVPKYSRFPGDKLGLSSVLGQLGLNLIYGMRANIRDYAVITQDFGPTEKNDIVAYPSEQQSNARTYELSAIAPDLFDVAYYSIQPNFGKRYLEKLIRLKSKLGLSDKAFPRGDLGSRGQGTEMQFFSVEDQLKWAHGENQQNLPNLHNSEAYWFIREQKHLLTSWVHNDAFGDYFAFPSGRFGECNEYDWKYEMKAPGGCMDHGGRVGYSVKLVSPEIFKAQLRLGGKGQGAGTILNPPAED